MIVRANETEFAPFGTTTVSGTANRDESLLLNDTITLAPTLPLTDSVAGIVPAVSDAEFANERLNVAGSLSRIEIVWLGAIYCGARGEITKPGVPFGTGSSINVRPNESV